MNGQNLREENWEPTRKELEIGENNAAPITKIIYEQKKKKLLGFEVENAVNIVVKTVGVLAIFFPLFLLWYQRKLTLANERQKEKALLFGQITKNYATFFRKQKEASISLNTIDSVSFLLSSELDFADKKNQLFQRVDNLNNNLSVYAGLGQSIALMDSLTHTVESATDAFEEVFEYNKSSKTLAQLPTYHALLRFITNFEKVKGIELDTVKGDQKLDTINNKINVLLQSSFEAVSWFNNALTQNAAVKYQDNNANSLSLPDKSFITMIKDRIPKYRKEYEDRNKEIKALLHQFFEELRVEFQEIKEQMKKEIKV